MYPALWIAKTGLDAQQVRMSTISHNLANINTTGFKRGRAIFEDLLYQNVRQAGGDTSENSILPTGINLGTGVRIVATEKLFTQGGLEQTERPLDVAIRGRGFLEILMPDGTTAYTRDGTFQVDDQGRMVTSSGYEVQPGIVIPENSLSITIGNDGTVSALLPGQTQPSQLGSLQLSLFINPAGLQPAGENLFLETAASGSPQTGTPGIDGRGSLIQGSLESSNVNAVEELVNMIETQRAYEMNSRAISTTDDMLAYVNNNL